MRIASCAVDFAHDDALLQLADAEDRRLALVDDDRRGEQAAGHAVVGDGEAAARDVGGGRACPSRARLVRSSSLGADLLEAERARRP